MNDDSNLDIMMKEELRNFIYELTFVMNKQANENLI